MTIIQPNKEGFRIDFLLFVLIVLVLGGIYGAVNMYNKVVGLRHAIKAEQAEIVLIQDESVELHNKLRVLEPKHLMAKAKEMGMVLDQSPVYLEMEHTDKSLSGL